MIHIVENSAVVERKLKKLRQPKVFEGVLEGKYYLINTMVMWKQFYAKLMQQKLVACDTETTGLSFTKHHIIGFSFSWGAENSYYVPIRHETNEK